MNDEIARLEKEVNDLKSRAREIGLRLEGRQRELSAAKVAELTTEYAARGIVPGCKVVAVLDGRDGKQRRTVCGFGCVSATSWGSVTPVLTKIKKDGSVGKQPTIIRFDRLELAPDQ